MSDALVSDITAGENLLRSMRANSLTSIVSAPPRPKPETMKAIRIVEEAVHPEGTLWRMGRIFLGPLMSLVARHDVKGGLALWLQSDVNRFDYRFKPWMPREKYRQSAESWRRTRPCAYKVSLLRNSVSSRLLRLGCHDMDAVGPIIEY